MEKHTGQAKELVNSIEDIMGKYPGHRRAHARGYTYEAEFQPEKESANYSSSLLFKEDRITSIVRFSHSSPDPTMADSLSPIKGMAVKFLLPNSEEVNMVTATVSIFVAKNPEAFVEMIRIGQSMKKGKPRLTKMVKLLRKYPESQAALKLYRKIEAPSSFAAGTYYSIHAFYLVTDSGKRQPVKFLWEPLNDTESSKKGESSLEEELDERIKHQNVQFNLTAQLGEEGDPVDDPTVEWPKERRKVVLGCLTVRRKLVSEEEDLIFDPTITGGGIECSEDKILQFRKSVYAVSHKRRKKQM